MAHDRGQLDTGAAEIYDDFFVPALFGRAALQLADLGAFTPSESVLDIACGSGALTRELRRRTTGRVAGVDVNPAMLAVARSRCHDVEFHEADALQLPFDDTEFDVATCQYGLMFFADQVGGLREMARVARRGIVAVWDSIERSTGYSALQAIFRSELGDDAASSLDAPFSLGTPGVLEQLLVDAGIDADIHHLDGTGRFDSIEQWVTTEIRGWTLGASVSDKALAKLVTVAEDRLAEFASSDGCIFGMSTKAASWPRQT